MNPRLHMLTIGLGLAAAISAQASAPKAGPRHKLLLAITRATRQADVPTLARLYRNGDPLAHALAAMALERIHFHLRASSKIATLCEQSLIDSAPRVALYCARYEVGNTAIARGPHAAVHAEERLLAHFQGKLPRTALARMQHYVATHKDIPAFTVVRSAHGFRIPLQARRGRGRLELQALANGHPVMLETDTGAGFLSLGPKLAKRLGVRMLGLKGKVNGFISHNIPVQLGVLDNLRIGDEVVAHNVPVEVSNNHKHLIGIEVLRRLGTFRLSSHALTVYGNGDRLPICRQPLLVGSSVWGPGVRVVKVLPINGKPRRTMLDSGGSLYFSGDRKALSELHAYHSRRLGLRDLGSGVHHVRVDRAQARVIIANQPFLLTFFVFEDARLAWHYRLGNGALRDMDFFFDFRHRHACLLLHPHLH